MSPTPRPAAERFWAKVNKSGECWLWTACVNKDGYGKFGVSDKRTVQAHKFSLELAGVVIPAGMVVDHKCHNPACVRPKHLRVTTHKQNCENRKGAQMDNKSSGIRGVSWQENMNSWKGSVRHNGVLIAVGYFSNINDAEQAVIAKRNELFTHNDADRAAVAA